MKRILSLALALALLLCACASQSADETGTSEPVDETIEQTEAETDPVETEAETNPTETEAEPSEAALLYVNPLNGEAIAEPYTARPVAVMLNNILAAMPQHGQSQADILYEVLAEGGITRCMAVYSDVSAVPKIGSVRSSRLYYVELAQSYDAIYVHAGGSTEALNYLSSSGWADIDGNSGSSSYFYRDSDRISAGYAWEHTLFTSGPQLVAAAEALGLRSTVEEGTTFGLEFDDSTVYVGSSAETVQVKFGIGTKTTSFTYNADDSLYYAAQFGSDYIDGTTGEALTFRNLLVLRTSLSVLSGEAGYLRVDTTGSGTGYYMCNGQCVAIRWSRESVTDPFTYTLESGAPLVLSPGKTYIAVVSTSASIQYS